MSLHPDRLGRAPGGGVGRKHGVEVWIIDGFVAIQHRFDNARDIKKANFAARGSATTATSSAAAMAAGYVPPRRPDSIARPRQGKRSMSGLPK